MQSNLNELVLAELNLLRQHATREELDKLNFIRLNPSRPDECIYGQLTGCCFSDRAIELLNLCAKPYSEYLCHDEFYPPKTEKFIVSNRDFSPLEYYISQPGAKNILVILYLREGDNLTVNDL